MVVDRSGLHEPISLTRPLPTTQHKFHFHFLPAHCGHHLNPIEGFWRVMKDAMVQDEGWLPTLSQLYTRTRQVLMAHQERPIYEFHW